MGAWEATITRIPPSPALSSPVLIYVLGYAEVTVLEEARQSRKYVNFAGWSYSLRGIPIDSILLRNFAIRTVTIELVLVKLKPCISFVFECQIISYLLASACYTGRYRFWSHLYQPRLRLLCTTTASGQHFPVWPSHSVSKIFLYDFKKYFSLNFRDRVLLLSKYHFLGPL